MVLLTNIDSWVSVDDTFIAQWINDCWQVELLKVDEEEVVCPDGVSFSSSVLSGNVLAWCYDGTETVTLYDSHLLASNIKSWITIFWVTGTFTWIAWINWVSFNIPAWTLSTNIPVWNYDWAETITASDPNLVAWNIKSWVDLFWTTGTYVWDANPVAFTGVGYHIWHTHWPIYAGWYDKFTTEYSVGVAQDANNLYLCYSSYVASTPYWWGNNYYTVVRYNAWVLTTILSRCENASAYYWHHTVFTQSPTPWYFRVVYWYDGWTTYFCEEVNISTWAYTYSFFTSVEALLPSSTTFDGKVYEPILADTVYFDKSTSYLDPYDALSCNVNIYT